MGGGSELAAAVAGLEPPTLLLDGEIAVFDSRLLSRFEWLRGHPKDERATPTMLIAFDCVYARGKDLRERPLCVRRNVLEAFLEGQSLVLPARRLAPTASRPGPRSSRVASRGWSARTRPRPTGRAGRSHGRG